MNAVEVSRIETRVYVEHWNSFSSFQRENKSVFTIATYVEVYYIPEQKISEKDIKKITFHFTHREKD